MDLHSHLLPGLDDGARDTQEALQLMKTAANDGVAGIVATPHFVIGGYMPSRETILSNVEELRALAQAEGLSVSIYPGSECYLEHGLIDLLNKGEVLTINDGGKYLLVELPRMNFPSHAHQLLFELQLEGITPILAHPERNIAIAREPNLLIELIDRGILTQMNSGSLLGFYGSKVQEVAYILMSHKMVHMIGTDSHNPKRAEGLSLLRAFEEAEKLVDEAWLRYIKDVPGRIVRGEEIGVPEPLEYRPRRKGLLSKLFLRWRD
jgi:protein-tyrosine phosphatase